MMNLLSRRGEFVHLLFEITHFVVWAYVSLVADIWVANAFLTGNKSTLGMACAIVSIQMAVMILYPKR